MAHQSVSSTTNWPNPTSTTGPTLARGDHTNVAITVQSGSFSSTVGVVDQVNCSVSGSSGSYVLTVPANTSGSVTSYSATFQNTFVDSPYNWIAKSIVSGTISITPPTGVSFGAAPTTEVQNIGVQVFAVGGSGGTPQVQSPGGSGATVNSGFTYQRNRGYTSTWRATRDGGTTWSGYTSYTYPYLDPTASGSLTGASIAYSASTTYTFGDPGVAATHDYRINTGTVNSAAVTVPAAVGTYAFTLQTRRKVAYGGDASSWSNPFGSVDIIRLPVSPPDTITLSDAGTASNTTSVTATASGGTTEGALQVSVGSGSYQSNPHTFTGLIRNTAYTFHARRVVSGVYSTVKDRAYTPPYLPTSTAGTISASTTNPPYTGNTSPTITLTIGSKAAGHDYYVDGVAIGSGTTVNKTLAANSGSTATYVLTVIRPTSYGGNGSSVVDGSVTVTRAIAPPTAVSLVSGTDESSLTTVTATASGNFFAGDGTTLRVSGTPFTTWVANGYSWSGKTRGTAYTFKGKRIVGGVSSTLVAATLTIPYLATAQSGALQTATIAYSAPTSYTMGFATAVPGTHDYRINLGTANSAVVTVPATAGNHAFSLQTRRKVASGGDPALAWSGSFGEINITRSEDSSGNAPVISSVTNNNNAGTSVTATVNLSSNGSGGTLEYAQTSSNSVPSTGWQSGNTFTHARNTTKYYWARQSDILVGAVESHAVGYLTGDTDVSASNDTISSSATSASTNVTLGTSGETYAVRVENGSTNLADRTGNGAISFTGSLPTGTNTTTYEIFVRRPTSTGGDGSTYTATNDTFTVNRQAAGGGGGGTSYGLQVRNASDQLVLEVSDRVPRFVSTGSSSYTTGSGPISVTGITGMANDDTWAVVVNSTQPYGGVEVVKGTNSFTMKQTGIAAGGQTATLRYIVLRT